MVFAKDLGWAGLGQIDIAGVPADDLRSRWINSSSFTWEGEHVDRVDTALRKSMAAMRRLSDLSSPTRTPSSTHQIA
jgi:hypothetical protein